MIEIIKAVESLFSNVEIDIKVRGKGSEERMEDNNQRFLLQVIDNLLDATVLGAPAVASLDAKRDIAKDGSHKQIPEELELLTLTLKDFMSQVLKMYPRLEGYIYHAFLTDHGILVLMCDLKVNMYMRSIIENIEKEARRKVGVNAIYVVSVEEDVELTEKLLDEVLDEVVKNYKFETTNFEGLKVTEKMENIDEGEFLDEEEEDEYDGDEEDDESEMLTMGELYEYIKRQGKDEVEFPVELSDEILRYLGCFDE